MKSKVLSFFLIAFTTFCISQEITVQEDNSLEGQFDKIYRTSTSYQTYKVIGKERYLLLKKNVLDSIKKANKIISEKENLIKNKEINTTDLNSELNKTKEELLTVKQQVNSISLLGFQVSKLTYNLILWLIIILLASALTFFIFKFTKSNILTKKAQKNLEDVEYDFEKHRKKSLEREQKLRRQLQDEINKQRNS